MNIKFIFFNSLNKFEIKIVNYVDYKKNCFQLILGTNLLTYLLTNNGFHNRYECFY